ncbi:hypothetical protein [Leptospira meyeri]|uniref:hypothetical protein n=1 Tax=Leptospira meyeri TaxID=29508 RepID=UPI000C29A13F|nr:hypothetical protein [Leptospira meyeri]PJZ80333.1 hypothetical protein CH359_13675 [Leptospira meyeri]PJZ95524.1 hypothetical protein CH358_16915 [Leptospira meyeri]TGL12444.1 hypothetical protein EHQ50_11645 [Leptospira meyeri]
MKQWIILLLLVLSFVSCEDPKKESRSNAEGFFVIWFETLFRSTGYDSACDKTSESMPLSLNSLVTLGTFSQRYRITTGASGLKYAFTLSGDYPNCGVTLLVYNCAKPNVYARNSDVNCDSGTFSNHVSGATQTCVIPSFANQMILILIQQNSSLYPTTKCSTITFEALP